MTTPIRSKKDEDPDADHQVETSRLQSDSLAGDLIEALDPQVAPQLLQELVGGGCDGRAEPEALGQGQDVLGLEAVQRVDRSGEAVDGLVLIPDRDDLSVSLKLDDGGDDRVGILRLIEEDHVGLDLGLAQVEELEVDVVRHDQALVGEAACQRPVGLGQRQDVSGKLSVGGLVEAVRSRDVVGGDLQAGRPAELGDGLSGDPSQRRVLEGALRLLALVIDAGVGLGSPDADDLGCLPSGGGVTLDPIKGLVRHDDGTVGEAVSGAGIGVGGEAALGLGGDVRVVGDVGDLGLELGLGDHREGAGLAGACEGLDRNVVAGQGCVDDVLLLRSGCVIWHSCIILFLSGMSSKVRVKDPIQCRGIQVELGPRDRDVHEPQIGGAGTSLALGGLEVVVDQDPVPLKPLGLVGGDDRDVCELVALLLVGPVDAVGHHADDGLDAVVVDQLDHRAKLCALVSLGVGLDVGPVVERLERRELPGRLPVHQHLSGLAELPKLAEAS